MLLPRSLNKYIASDLAVSEPDEGAEPDFTEHGVFGAGGGGGCLYPLDWWHGQKTADVWIDALLDLVVEHKPLAWFGEGGVIRRAVEPFLKKRMNERKVYFRIVWINSISDKATRGVAFQGRASMGKIIFPETRWAQRVIDQCVGFPGAKNDDAFDVMSLMCMVIDQAHPALLPDKPKPKRDRYDREESTDSWKVA